MPSVAFCSKAVVTCAVPFFALKLGIFGFVRFLTALSISFCTLDVHLIHVLSQFTSRCGVYFIDRYPSDRRETCDCLYLSSSREFSNDRFAYGDIRHSI